MGLGHKRKFANLIKLDDVWNTLFAHTKCRTRRDAKVAITKLFVKSGTTPLKKFAKPVKTIFALTLFWVSLVNIKPHIDTPLPILAQIIHHFFFVLAVRPGAGEL